MKTFSPKPWNLEPETSASRGVTLIDTIVGTALMLVIFLGIAAAFELSVDVVSNNKARSGAIALANERMEYMRSLAYASIGTVGGIPSGTITQSETVTLNGVPYTRRTFVEYRDDPQDGLGAADSNGIIEDYKAAKVDVSWMSRTGTRHIVLVSRFETPNGMETSCTPPCGTLVIDVVNAASQPLSGASVSIVNASTTPTININTFTNASGTAMLIGAPAAPKYQIVVSNTGYSTAQTYSVTSQNTNPSPGHLTVANNQTTTGTFAIDVLSSKTISTWNLVQPGTWTDGLSNLNSMSTSTNVIESSGTLILSGGAGSYAATGTVQSIAISPSNLNTWRTFTASTTVPANTSIKFSFYDGSGALIPDSVIPNNSIGVATTSMSLANVSTSTYPTLLLGAMLTSSDGSATPIFDSYSIGYTYGPTPLPNIPFSLQGTKTIGTGPSGNVYKYNSQNLNTGASASFSTTTLEWDSYTITIGSGSGYDVASSCPSPQPIALSPAASEVDNLYLAPHTTNSLLIDVRSNATDALVQNATVVLSRTGFTATSTTDACGQVFFGGLTSASDYTVQTSATGYVPNTQTNVTGSGTATLSITL